MSNTFWTLEPLLVFKWNFIQAYKFSLGYFEVQIFPSRCIGTCANDSWKSFIKLCWLEVLVFNMFLGYSGLSYVKILTLQVPTDSYDMRGDIFISCRLHTICGTWDTRIRCTTLPCPWNITRNAWVERKRVHMGCK